jgi:predicted phosphodiesterase
MTAIALVSDIHSNLPALEAVAADLRARAPDLVYVLGDIVNGAAWPAESLDLLAELRWPMLLGNHDDAVLQLGTPRMEPRYESRERYGLLWWTRAQLSDRHLRLLEALPLDVQLPLEGGQSLRLFHGIPGNFFLGFRPDTPDDSIAKEMQKVTEPVAAGGHTHVAMARPVGRWLVVNSGSVGAPFDSVPGASYAWLEVRAGSWSARVVRVPYDLAPVVAAYREKGLEEAGGAFAEMFMRSVATGLPWIADFAWWMRGHEGGGMAGALRTYDARHGPGRWAFPMADEPSGGPRWED